VNIKIIRLSNFDASFIIGTSVEIIFHNTEKVNLMQDILFNFIAQYITLNDEEKEVIKSLSLFHKVKKGTILLREGQKSKQSYLLIKGCIREYYIVDGEEKTTAFYTEMDAITPQCVTDNVPSTYYINCLEDCILLISTLDMEEEINAKFPKFEIMCRKMAEERLAKKHKDFDQFKITSPEQRYLNLLQSRPDLIQRVPQHQLASYLGIKPQSLSRIKSRIFDKLHAHLLT
jgi:CRP-like cAMP-binding protein